MKYTQTIPATRVVDWTTFKAHARIDSDSEQTIGELYLDAVTADVEAALATSLITRTITAVYYDGEPIHLPRGPLVAVTSVTSDGGNAVTDYDVERVGNSDRLRINAGFSYPLTVVYTAGHGATAASVPANIRAVILLEAAARFESREALTPGTNRRMDGLAGWYRLHGRSTGIA